MRGKEGLNQSDQCGNGKLENNLLAVVLWVERQEGIKVAFEVLSLNIRKDADAINNIEK